MQNIMMIAVVLQTVLALTVRAVTILVMMKIVKMMAIAVMMSYFHDENSNITETEEEPFLEEEIGSSEVEPESENSTYGKRCVFLIMLI